MKKKITRLIILLSLMLLALTLGACKIGMPSKSEIIDKNNLEAQVTYYANGGWFYDSNSMVSREVYYKADDKAYDYGVSSGTSNGIKVHHVENVCEGWYTVEIVEINGENYFVCDVEEGEIGDYKINETAVVISHGENFVIKISDYQTLVANKKKDVTVSLPSLELDEPFDFENRKLAKGDKIYLAAKWVPDQKIEYYLITEDCTSITVGTEANAKTYNDRDLILTLPFDTNGKYNVKSGDVTPVEATDATFVDYYVYSETPDVNNLTLLSSTASVLSRPEDGSNIKIFVKYVAGSWKVVRTATDVKKIFTEPLGKYYVSKDIDCSAMQAISPVSGVAGKFVAQIRGNGHVISGLKVEKALSQNLEKTALFGTLDGTAVIKDITFENITFTCNASKKGSGTAFFSVYLIAHTLSGEGTPTIDNVNFNGVTLAFNFTQEDINISNIPYGNNYDTSSWFFVNKTNVELLNEYSSLEIENYKLVINSETVCTDIVEP